MAYPGGSETPLALGQVPDIDAAIAAGNAASAVADPSAATPQQSTIPAAVDPTKPAPQQGMGGGMKFSAKPANYGGQRMTAQDFVPHPDPYTIVDDGHSFSRAAFNLSAPAIAARLQGLAKENEELNKLTGDVFKQDTKEVVPAQYSRSYNALWDRGEKEYRASILAQYGGRQDLAAKAIAGKDSNNPEAHRGYLRFNRDMDEIGRIITHDVAEAEKNVEEMQTGKRKWNQASFDSSQELINAANSRGSEGLGDIQALMKAGSDYKRDVTLPYFLGQKDKDGKSIDDTVNMFMYHTFPRNADGTPRFEVQKNGMNKFMFHEDQMTADKMIDNLAEELYPQFRMEYPTKEAFRTALQNHYPTSSEIKVDDSYKPSSSGSSGSGSSANPGYSTSYQYGPIQTASGTNKYDQIPLAHVSAGKGRLAAPNQFTDVTGKPVFMHPTAIVEKNGELQVFGKVAKEPGTSRVDQDENGNLSFMVTDKETGEEKKVSETQYFNTLQDYFVPYDEQNEGSVENSFPGLTKQKVVSILEAGKSKRGVRKQSAAATAPTKTTPEDYKPEQITSALKKAGAAKGKTYTMADWENASPQARANMMKAYGTSTSTASARTTTPLPSAAERPAPRASTSTEQPRREASQPAATTTPAAQGPKEETPVIHKAAVVRDTLQVQKMEPVATGMDAMRNRIDANIEPGTYQFKNAEEADAAQGVSQTGKVTDPDPKGFFTGGNIVESKIGDKKVFFIMDKTGMRPLSDYFEDKQSAKLVLDAFERGEIVEEFLSKRSRSTKAAFDKLKK